MRSEQVDANLSAPSGAALRSSKVCGLAQTDLRKPTPLSFRLGSQPGPPPSPWHGTRFGGVRKQVPGAVRIDVRFIANAVCAVSGRMV